MHGWRVLAGGHFSGSLIRQSIGACPPPPRAHPIRHWYMQRDCHAHSLCAAHDVVAACTSASPFPMTMTSSLIASYWTSWWLFTQQWDVGASSTTQWSALRIGWLWRSGSASVRAAAA